MARQEGRGAPRAGALGLGAGAGLGLGSWRGKKGVALLVRVRAVLLLATTDY